MRALPHPAMAERTNAHFGKEFRHCERSEAIHIQVCTLFWIAAAARGRLAMTPIPFRRNVF